jgi:hypothetical protein
MDSACVGCTKTNNILYSKYQVRIQAAKQVTSMKQSPAWYLLHADFIA